MSDASDAKGASALSADGVSRGDFIQRKDGNSNVHIVSRVYDGGGGNLIARTICRNGWGLEVVRVITDDTTGRDCKTCFTFTEPPSRAETLPCCGVDAEGNEYYCDSDSSPLEPSDRGEQTP